MNLKNKWSMMAGAVLVSGAVLTAGLAFAETGSSSAAATSAPAAASAPATAQAQAPAQKDPSAWINEQVAAGTLTQAQGDVMKQIESLRSSTMTKLQADEKAILDQAVKDGKITQAQADEMAQHKGPGFGGERGGKGGRGGKGHGRFAGPAMTQDELKAKLDEHAQTPAAPQSQTPAPATSGN